MIIGIDTFATVPFAWVDFNASLAWTEICPGTSNWSVIPYRRIPVDNCKHKERR